MGMIRIRYDFDLISKYIILFFYLMGHVIWEDGPLSRSVRRVAVSLSGRVGWGCGRAGWWCVFDVKGARCAIVVAPTCGLMDIKNRVSLHYKYAYYSFTQVGKGKGNGKIKGKGLCYLLMDEHRGRAVRLQSASSLPAVQIHTIHTYIFIHSLGLGGTVGLSGRCIRGMYKYYSLSQDLVLMFINSQSYPIDSKSAVDWSKTHSSIHPGTRSHAQVHT